MAEYIEREVAYCEFCADETMSGYEKAYCCEIIKTIPAADVAPVRHGRWIMTAYTTVSKRNRIISNKKFHVPSVHIPTEERKATTAKTAVQRWIWGV